ncbi:helix-turn-helix transcriptional regulator [Arthrobacter sp. JSM 101049]|uniref:helix-turn-helix transcriptional regulator n=1 Tax=Arthrobacter sp. JSM 101049 TaxID=929097 RepID=UPI00356A07BF
MQQLSQHERVEAVAAVADPLRAAIFDVIARSEEPLGREQVAEAVGIARQAAAFQLDKLADQGLLEVSYRRLNGATGPGAGRPSKVYGAVHTEVTASVPHREYPLAADIMAAAIEAARADGGPVDSHLAAAARSTGRRLAADQADLEHFLTTYGYRPESRPDGTADLTNCPFHALSSRHTDTVCDMNEDFIGGALEALEPGRRAERVAPGQPCGCCVRLTSAPAPDTDPRGSAGE